MSNDQITYRITAHDLLFFGTGRPFSMEDESWTLGIFPPHPATLYGFLRSIYFEKNMGELSKATKDNDPTKGLKILDYHLELENEGEFTHLFTLPNCFLKNGDKPEKLKLDNTNGLISNYPFKHFLKSSEGKKEGYGPLCFITKDDLQNFLNGKEISKVIDLSKVMKSEDRIGISKDRTTGLAEDGKLYRVQFADTAYYEAEIFKKIHFNITVSGLVSPLKHGRRLGGEGKIAFLEKSEEPSISFVNNMSENDHPNVIYIQTPCIFNSLEELEKELKEYNLNVLCISNNGFVDIGGWDIQENMPKTMEAALPAGSLVFIEGTGDLTNLKSFGKDTEQGFGKILIGTY